MPERLRYLVAYDIRDPARLRRVHKLVKGFGEPLQYSIFVCDLTKTELLGLKRALHSVVNEAVDSIGIFDLGTPNGRGVACVEYIGVRRALPDPTDPAIW